MIIAIISPFTAVFAVSVVVLGIVSTIAVGQLYYDFKHPDQTISLVVHCLWLGVTVFSLGVLNWLAFKVVSQQNLMYFLAIVVALTAISIFVLNWIDPIIYKVKQYIKPEEV